MRKHETVPLVDLLSVLQNMTAGERGEQHTCYILGTIITKCMPKVQCHTQKDKLTSSDVTLPLLCKQWDTNDRVTANKMHKASPFTQISICDHSTLSESYLPIHAANSPQHILVKMAISSSSHTVAFQVQKSS